MIGTLFGAIAALAIRGPQPDQNVILAVSTSSVAVVAARPAPPIKIKPNSLGVKTSSPSAFVADVGSGSVLFAKNAHDVMPIASLTKLMTAMVFLDMHPDLTKKIVFTDADQDNEEAVVIPSGQTLTQEDVLRAMLVGSVNAAAAAIARTSVGTPQFVALMNQKAHDLGLSSPEFFEPTGLNPDNKADAADVAAMLSIATSYPEIRAIAKLPEVIVHGLTPSHDYKIDSTNLLLPTYLNKPPYKIVAAKTGSLPEAGYCMAQITSDAQGHEIVAVELGSDNHFSRYQDVKALTTWAFDTYSWK
ncbi:MAG: serine hydrolase [Patescibacteria group bacterium]